MNERETEGKTEGEAEYERQGGQAERRAQKENESRACWGGGGIEKVKERMHQ